MPLDPENDETVAMGVTPTSANKKQRFEPGQLLASRYRIVSRLGQGGMGEVFRAEDIMLGQPVALKFLPEHAGRNINLLTRFYDEVRIARQISHANVCRVYDIGEIDGQPYLSMEYIDGEDLSSLLRRIGRLPGDKATEFARKMCAGLAAAHAQGVLHRDIKPGNIMIDGKGEPRITDFGLAAVASAIEGNEIRNGTPAYMAPEQLEGREVTVQSDLYALGLVFHEMFTGKVAHEAETVAELTAKRKETRVIGTATLVGDLDPAVDRAIQACLQPDPKLRPKSALDLARMLPGGDPLAAALAAGQTPSPETVAAAGTKEALSPRIGIALLAALFALLGVAIVMIPAWDHKSKFPLPYPPEVLMDKARTILRTAGYEQPPADFVWGFTSNQAARTYLSKHFPNPEQWDEVLTSEPNDLTFWYRESPQSLLPSMDSDGRSNYLDPEMSLSGMTRLNLRSDGKLVQFDAVPPRRVKPTTAAPAPVDWAPFFQMAGLDIVQFQAVTPEWSPQMASDARMAWTGEQPVVYRTSRDFPLRIEAASFAGRPVYFQVIYPWTQAEQVPAANASSRYLIAGGFTVLLIGLMLMAKHHWTTGRADRQGAFRISAWAAILGGITWALRAHHAGVEFELKFVPLMVAQGLFGMALYWSTYMALEPWVRRFWPEVLITWTRLWQGQWRDPLVGRDVLIGAVAGVVFALYSRGVNARLIALLKLPLVGTLNSETLQGTGSVLALLLGNVRNGISAVMLVLALLFFLRLALRKQWLAFAAYVLVMSAPSALQSSYRWIALPFQFGVYSIVGFVMLRRGAFAGMMMLFVANNLTSALFTSNYAAWYGESSWMVLVMIAAMGTWGYWTATEGRSLFADAAAGNAQG